FLQRRNQCIELFLRGGNRQSWFEPRDCSRKMIAASISPRLGGKTIGNPDFDIPFCYGPLRTIKAGRHDADDLISVAIQPQTSAQNMRIAGDRPLPYPVADDTLQVELGCAIFRIEGAA